MHDDHEVHSHDGSDDNYGVAGLLSSARATYGRAIRHQLELAEIYDMPQRGTFILGVLSNGGTSQAGLPEAMGVSKQAVSQIVDQLVLRGYVERIEDPEDRRRQTLALTPLGEAASAVGGAAVNDVDQQLAAIIGDGSFETMRRGLLALSRLQ